MSENCTSGSCSTCNKDCKERSLLVEPHKLSKIKKVIAVVSGKGGVGKSSVTAMLASAMRATGKSVGVMDADITGPSIPKVFGVDNEKAYATEDGLYPVKTKTGIDIMSINLLLEKPTDPVVWRGPVIAGVVKQFWNEVIWENEDYLFIDMPPGTGDVPLTVFQSIPVDGIIIVTSPQDLVSMIVAKAVKMAEMMHIKVLGIVENYSYFVCDNCDKKHYIYGESKVEEIAKEYGLPVLAQLPINRSVAEACDKGEVESLTVEPINNIVKNL